MLVDKVEEAFTCPFCGAPYRELIPSGVVQVKCQYCGATVLVPPRLGGAVQRCPNHPDVLAIGLCNDCGGSYCGRCLYIHKVRERNSPVLGIWEIHLCSKCYSSRQKRKVIGAIIATIFMLIIGVPMFMATLSFPFPGSVVFSSLFILFILMDLNYVRKIARKARSIHARTLAENRPKQNVLKKCVRCQREIPIASHECQYCGIKLPWWWRHARQISKRRWKLED